MINLKVAIQEWRARLARWIEPDHRRSSQYDLSLREWLIYHQNEINFQDVSWMGIRTLKNVLDLWIYQEILFEVQPDIVIEIGSYIGGSTLFLAHMLDIIGKGKVISIDIDRSRYRVSHDRIMTLTGDSQSDLIITETTGLVEGKSVLVIHDSNHKKEHVLKDLEIYSNFVSLGSYLIVEDGIVDIMTTDFKWYDKEGPLAAVESFLKKNPHFEVDTKRERYLLTYNPKGYLKRVR